MNRIIPKQGSIFEMSNMYFLERVYLNLISIILYGYWRWVNIIIEIPRSRKLSYEHLYQHKTLNSEIVHDIT